VLVSVEPKYVTAHIDISYHNNLFIIDIHQAVYSLEDKSFIHRRNNRNG